MRAQNPKFVVLTEGTVTLPKILNEPWAEGALIYFNPAMSGGFCTSVSGVPGLIGSAETTVNPSATGKLRLNGNARAAGCSYTTCGL